MQTVCERKGQGGSRGRQGGRKLLAGMSELNGGGENRDEKANEEKGT